MKNKKYIFNPYYSIRNDKKRILLTNSPAFKIPRKIAEDNIETFVHPIFGIIFALFDGKRDLKLCISKISNLFEVSNEVAFNFIKPFLQNKKRVGIEYEGDFLEFPENILIENDNKEFPFRKFNYNDYIIDEELDLYTQRLFMGPSTVSLLVNTECATDCIYCYVDRSVKTGCKIPIERIKELIRESKNIGVVSFDIAGTEIFMYKHWEELIIELLKNNYYPYLSTKLPISEKIITKLKSIGINDIQISIDSLDPDEIKIVNKVKREDNYIEKMFYTLSNLEKHNFNVGVNVVLTKFNSTINGITSLLNKVNKFSNIEELIINPAERATNCLSDDFDNFKNKGLELEEIKKHIISIRNDYKFNLAFASYTRKSDYDKEFEEKKISHESRSLCTANMSQLAILNDGQVTICEELYWNPKFLIGNVISKSIKEIWSSDKACKLAGLKRDDFRDDSICKTCSNFDICRLGKGVCWSNVASAYGEENWDYPASECPYAPKLLNSVHHD